MEINKRIKEIMEKKINAKDNGRQTKRRRGKLIKIKRTYRNSKEKKGNLQA